MKKGTKILLTVLVGALVLGILATAGLFYAREHFILWNGIPLSLQARRLDLREKPMPEEDFFRQFPNLRTLDARGTGMTPEEHDTLLRTYAGLEILWDVPFQDQYIDNRAEKIKLTSLKPEEIRNLTYLTQMTSIDAWACEDYAALVQLQKTLPNCKIFYSVTLAGQEFDCDIKNLTLHNADGTQLLENLQYLPAVTAVHLTGTMPKWTLLEQVMKFYPDIAFTWQVEALGQTLDQNTESLTISRGQAQSVEQLEELLPYMPELKKADLLDCDLDREALVDLALRWPEIDFLFDLQIGHVNLRTDAVEIDISNHVFENTRQVERYVNCFYNLEKAVMCECGIPNEEMDALNKKYDDIRFVWSVQLGVKLFRTDAIYYTPNSWGEKCFDETIYNLRYCTDMICVDIGHMKDVTNCEWAAFMPNLKYLILAQTAIRDLTPLSGLKNLVFLELFQSKTRDYSPLVSITSLEDLNLSYTFGDPAPIAQMTWLKRLWWSGSWFARTTLPEILTNTEMEFYEVSSTGGTWREGKHYYDMRDLIGMPYMTG